MCIRVVPAKCRIEHETTSESSKLRPLQPQHSLVGLHYCLSQYTHQY